MIESTKSMTALPANAISVIGLEVLTEVEARIVDKVSAETGPGIAANHNLLQEKLNLWKRVINYGNEYSAKVKVHINDVKVQCEADSGSSTNLIDEDRFQQIQYRLPASQKLKPKPTKAKLLSYADFKIPIIGCFRIAIENRETGKSEIDEFLVVKAITKSGPLLSLRT
ncbi:hypothetical protein SNE40_011171 [Patella caerulea]|uniref:Uncharacterized protein n=1 Tax=Patella caerulea TaxID=87958 RepID=A0AAN8JM60_PATCE